MAEIGACNSMDASDVGTPLGDQSLGAAGQAKLLMADTRKVATYSLYGCGYRVARFPLHGVYRFDSPPFLDKNTLVLAASL